MLSAPRAVVGLENATESPAVSVIIPTFNRAGLVTQAVDSILRQTVRDYEIIVVDDGSTDGTSRALQPYLSDIRYIRQENRGLASARNRGIEEARGEFLAFLDSDDRFEPRMLEVVLETFKRHPSAGSVATAEREIDSWNRQGDRVFTKRSPGIFFTPDSLVGRDTRVGCGRPAVVRSCWVETLGGFDEEIRCAVDCELWIRYSFHMPIVLQPEPLVLRRTHGANLSDNRKQDALDWLRILEKLAREQPEFVREHRATYRESLAKNYLRYGRELLADGDLGPEGLEEARRALRNSCRLSPWRVRAQIYLLWSYAAPSTYCRFRRWELEHIATR